MDLDSQQELITNPNKQLEEASKAIEIEEEKNLNIKKIVYQKTRQFWLNRLGKALKNVSQTQESPNVKLSFTQTIQDGLQLQEYLQRKTKFLQLYNVEIKNDQTIFKSRRPKPFVRKAKQMIHLFLQKNKYAQAYLLYRVDWVQENLLSYPYIVPNPICLYEIKRKLMNNGYQEEKDFYMDMNKMFEDLLVFSFHQKQLKNLFRKLLESWETIKCKVLQLYNFTSRKCINPTGQLEPEMMDIQAEINKLKGRVQISKDKTQYLDYDSEYFNQSSPNNDTLSNKDSQSQQRKTKKSYKKKNHLKFQSCVKNPETIPQQRILQLKADIQKRIQIERADRVFQNKKLLKYIQRTESMRPGFLGKSNEIDLKVLSFQEFVLLESLTFELLKK